MKPIQILINAKDNASKVFDSLLTKVTAVAAAIGAVFGIQAFAGAVKGAGDFEAAMSRVQAATNASAQEMERLTQAAKDGADGSGFTNVETADALTNLAKAGADANQSIAALPGVIALARAGEIGLSESSEYLTKIIASMGGEFADAGKYADVLAMGANASNTSVTGLAQALSYSAPAAKALNLSLEYTVGLIGKFADGGIDASRAGTALNSILSQFLDPASKFRNELALAGITTNNFEDALKQLAEAGPRGANAILAVGLEAGPALRGLLNAGSAALDDLVGKLRNAEGSAAATAKTLSSNLNGSLKSLSNVWQTVKDVLGTPVLPVLKQGVDELTQAFRQAVADGTVQRFGESIATAFRNGIQFVRDFVSTVDLSAVMARLQEFADRANETFTKIGEYATTAGNTLQLAYGVMSAGVNAVLTAIYGIGSVFAEVAEAVMKGVAALREGLASITFGELSESFKLAAEDARSAAEGFGDAAQAMRDKAAEALQDTAAAAQTARDGFEGLAGAAEKTAAATDTWAFAVAQAAAEIERSNKLQAEATAKTQAASKAAADHAASVRAAQESVAALRREYEAAVSDGNWQRATELQEQLNKALRGMKESAKDAADAAALVDAAFGRLGVTSTAKLKQLADSARADFETIRASGTATAEDLSRAFKVAAEAAIAANKGIAPSWVVAEAGVRGYKIAVDEAGRSTLEAANRGTEAIDRMARSWYANREAMEAQEDAMAQLLMRYTMTANLSERQIALLEREAAAAEKAAEAYRKKWNMDAEGYALNTKGERALQGETKEEIDADVARRYGQENVGNPLAEEARQLAKILADMAEIGGLSRIQSAESAKQIAEQRRRLQELEGILLNGLGKKPEGGRTGGSNTTTSGDDDGGGSSSRPGRSGSSSSGSGGGGGLDRGNRGGIVFSPTIVLNPGVDLSNKAEAERIARALIPAIGNLSRRGLHA